MNTAKIVACALSLVSLTSANQIFANEDWGSPDRYAASKIQLATYCHGDPETAEWQRFRSDSDPKLGHICYLPFWVQGSEQDVVLLHRLGTTCEPGEPSVVQREALLNPKTLFVRVPSGKMGKRTVRIAVRELTDSGQYGSWKLISGASINANRKILKIPFVSLPPVRSLQLRVEILEGNIVSDRQTVDFYVPGDC